jgi:hypothetical protein
MTFIETPIFTKRIKVLISDEEYRLFQHSLVLRPSLGKVITNGGGLRKVRLGTAGSGKRGSLRIIYFCDIEKDTIYLLLIYKKNEQENLTSNQLKILRNVMKEYLHE